MAYQPHFGKTVSAAFVGYMYDYEYQILYPGCTGVASVSSLESIAKSTHGSTFDRKYSISYCLFVGKCFGDV